MVTFNEQNKDADHPHIDTKKKKKSCKQNVNNTNRVYIY